MISLLLTLILGFASDSCNNKDIILILGYNYNLSHAIFTYLLKMGRINLKFALAAFKLCSLSAFATN